MVDVDMIDDSYHWVEEPGNLDYFVVPTVKRPQYRIANELVQAEYAGVRAGAPPRHEDVRKLDARYKTMPLKEIDPALMVHLRYDNTWPDVWQEIISPLFLYPNYNPRIGGPIKCFMCARPLNIPFLQEAQGGPFKLEADVELEDAVIFTTPCLHMVGQECAEGWLKSRYPNQAQNEYFRWVRGEFTPEEFDHDLQARIEPYHNNPAMQKLVIPGCPLCDTPLPIETNYGTETMDLAAAWRRFPTAVPVTKASCNQYAHTQQNAHDIPNWGQIILASKDMYREEVDLQLKVYEILKTMQTRMHAPGFREVGGGPYNVLDHAYLRNKVYQEGLTNHVGEALFRIHLRRQTHPETSDEDEDYYSDEDGDENMDGDDDDAGQGQAGQRQLLPVPNPWPLDYDTPPGDPKQCSYCDEPPFSRATARRKHEYVFHFRPDLGDAGYRARVARRRARRLLARHQAQQQALQ